HCIELTLTVTCNDNGLTAHIRGIEIVVVWNLAFMCQINPVGFRDGFHLQVKQGLICEYWTVQFKFTRLKIIHQQFVNAIYMAGVNYGNTRHVLSPTFLGGSQRDISLKHTPLL